MFLLFFSLSVLHICGYFPRHLSDFSSQVMLCVLLTVGREGRDSPTYWLSRLRRLCILPQSGWCQGPFVCWSPGSRSGWFRGPPWVEGSSQVVWSLRLTNPIPIVPGACCRGPSKLPWLPGALQPGMCEWRRHSDPRGKDVGVWLALLFPCPVLGFDFPFASVSKDQGRSLTFSRTNENLLLT